MAKPWVCPLLCLTFSAAKGQYCPSPSGMGGEQRIKAALVSSHQDRRERQTWDLRLTAGSPLDFLSFPQSLRGEGLSF